MTVYILALTLRRVMILTAWGSVSEGPDHRQPREQSIWRPNGGAGHFKRQNLMNEQTGVMILPFLRFWDLEPGSTASVRL